MLCQYNGVLSFLFALLFVSAFPFAAFCVLPCAISSFCAPCLPPRSFAVALPLGRSLLKCVVFLRSFLRPFALYRVKTMAIQWTMKMFLFRFVLKSGLPNARLRSFVDWMSFLRFAGRSQISLTFFAIFSKKTCATPDLVDILCDFYKQKHVQSQISLTFVCDFSSKIIMWDIIDILCDFSQQRVIICNLVDILCDFFQQRIMCTLMQSHWRYLRLSQQWIMCTCLHVLGWKANKEWYDPDHGTLRHFLNSSHSCTCGVRPMRSFHVSSHLISEFQTCPFRSFSSSCANFQRLRSWWHRGESCWEHENWNSIRWIEIRFAELKFQFAELKFQFAELVFQFIGSIQILSIRAIQFEFSINSHRFNSVNWNPNSIQWIELLELSFDSSNSRSESIHLFVFDSIRAVSCHKGLGLKEVEGGWRMLKEVEGGWRGLKEVEEG